MHVDYVDHMGSDLSVVNAARVSFDKESEVFSDQDAKLIKYLASHGHWSPFAHTSVSMRWKAPIFAARQLVKHQVGLTWNEVSRRYVNTKPELFWPKKWRKAADNVKQGSSEEEFQSYALRAAIEKAEFLVEYYNELIEEGMCPEQARMFLPQNMYTTWIWTGSLYAWARVYNQRNDPHAQKETRQLVQRMALMCSMLFPVSWEALMKKD